jgi:transcriptional regulator with XRE-family HTH domain
VPHPDDERLGRLLRLTRHRAGLTQVELARSAQIGVRDIRLIEAGNVGDVRVASLRRAFDATGGRAKVTAWWNGAAADRLLDEAHASIGEIAARLFVRRGWRAVPEVTFSEFGERGSIDLFASHERTRSVAVGEIKTAFGSLEETNRMLDVKVRLAPKIAERVFGWRPRFLGRLLIVPNESTPRRIIDRHAATMNAIYPGRSSEVRAWLRNPDSSISAIWFVSIALQATTIPGPER